MGADPQNAVIGHDEQRGSVFTKRTVAIGFSRAQGAKVFAFRRENDHAIRCSRPEVSKLINAHAIIGTGQVLFGQRSAVEKQARGSQFAISLDRKGFDIGILISRIRNVEGFFIGRKGDPVGPRNFLSQQAHVSFRRHPIDTAEVEFPGHTFVPTIGGIGEIEIAPPVKNKVVRAVETFPFEAIRDRLKYCNFSVQARDPGDPRADTVSGSLRNPASTR